MPLSYRAHTVFLLTPHGPHHAVEQIPQLRELWETVRQGYDGVSVTPSQAVGGNERPVEGNGCLATSVPPSRHETPQRAQ